jgi:hypothetical protein
MKQWILILSLPFGLFAQEPAPQKEILLHGFRSPSIGVEYRQGHWGIHGGAYTSILRPAKGAETATAWFAKTGVTTYFLPFHLVGPRRSELFASASYLRGLNEGWKSAVQFEPGVRLALTKYLDVRVGASLLRAQQRGWRYNPTIGVSWSFSRR